jgi:hypothetical protein
LAQGQNAGVSAPPSSPPALRREVPARQPAGIAAPSGRAPEAAPALEARRPQMMPMYSTRPSPSGQGAAGPPTAAPMPPSLSSEGAVSTGQRQPGRSNASQPALIAPLPPVTQERN